MPIVGQLIPKASVAALLVNPGNPNTEPDIKAMQTAAQAFGIDLFTARASNESELEAAFAMIVHRGVGALLIQGEPFFNSRRDQIAALAARNMLPTSYNSREGPEAGGLMSYGINRTDAYRLVGLYVARILKGEKAADLPVQQPTKFEFVINLKTARALGLTISNQMRLLADEVIE